MATDGEWRTVLDVAARDAERLARLDPVVALGAPGRGEGSRVLRSADGRTVGVAGVEVSGTVWTPPRVQRLVLHRVGDDVAGVAEVLDRWEAEVLDADPRAADPGTAAAVQVAAFDDAAVAPLVSRHFGRSAVLAVREVRERDAVADGAGGWHWRSAVRVRAATAADLDRLVAWAVALHEADRAYGYLPEVPGLAVRFRADLAEQVAAAPGWSLVAEVAGEPVGFCHALPPRLAGWVTPSSRVGPAGYVSLAWVEPTARRDGVGSALAAALHARAAADGVRAVLLHHAAASPRSGPFWARQGYRPLVGTWSRRPARR